MDLLKLALTILPLLVSLNYSEEASEIILALNTSLKIWEGVLMQLVHEKTHLL